MVARKGAQVLTVSAQASMANGRLVDALCSPVGGIAGHGPVHRTRDGPHLEWGPSLRAMASGSKAITPRGSVRAGRLSRYGAGPHDEQGLRKRLRGTARSGPRNRGVRGKRQEPEPLIALPSVLNSVAAELPRKPTDAMQTTAISATRRAYSTRLAPRCFGVRADRCCEDVPPTRMSAVWTIQTMPDTGLPPQRGEDPP